MSAMELSYSLLVMTYDRIYALRDPYGNRPLCVGRILFKDDINLTMANSTNKDSNSTLGYVAASESCAFPNNSEFLFEVEPGEMIEISAKGVKSIWQVNGFRFFPIFR